MIASELPDSLEWVNADPRPSLAALRGRVVLMHFWTFDSVNCANSLAELRFLESKYHDGLSVLGVHTPKYDYQRQAAPVLKAVNRHHIRHPVANDSDYSVWREYGVQSWPTMLLIDAQGHIAALLPGEGRRDEADQIIGKLLDTAAGQDLRVYETSVASMRPEPHMPLRFPNKVVATDTSLWVSDSGHNRILECDLDGRVVRQFGSGQHGNTDGRGLECTFNNPHGMALGKDALFVADTGNHAVRRIKLSNGDVDTVAGTGVLGYDVPSDHLAASRTRMSAPTDVAVIDDRLFIAMCGQRQIWQLDLVSNKFGVLAGDGRLGLNDGDGLSASFAQPAGLAAHGKNLLVIDSASSSVRSIQIDDARVTTLIGNGLYEFGDANGKRDTARLQNPLALCVDPRGLAFIADSYNGKVKALNLRSGELRALNLPYRLQEPSGISLAANALWIANTNAHEIVRVDLATGQVRRLTIGE